MKPTKEGLSEKIDAFLSKRRRSSRGGGWAEVEDKDIEDLEEINRLLIALKCEADADGDYPIEIEITNRRTHMRSHFQPVPYDKIDHDQYFGRTELNFDIALDAYRTARRLQDYRKREGRRKEVTAVLTKWAGIVYKSSHERDLHDPSLAAQRLQGFAGEV